MGELSVTFHHVFSKENKAGSSRDIFAAKSFKIFMDNVTFFTNTVNWVGRAIFIGKIEYLEMKKLQLHQECGWTSGSFSVHSGSYQCNNK